MTLGIILGASSAAAKVRACHGFVTSSGLHGQKTSRPNCANHAGAVCRIPPLARPSRSSNGNDGSNRAPRLVHAEKRTPNNIPFMWVSN